MSSHNPRRNRATANPDHTRRTHVPAPADRESEQRLTDLVQPASFAELAYYRHLRRRRRLRNLPVMIAVVLAMIWRHVPGVCTLQRMLARERIRWAAPTPVSQPALSERFLSFPAERFERVLQGVLAVLPARVAARTRPLLPLLQAVQSRFHAGYALDGSTLAALFRKLATVREAPAAPLAGHLVAATALATQLPARRWWAAAPLTNAKARIPDVLRWRSANTLLVFALGYFAFPFFAALTAKLGWFVTRQREKTRETVRRSRVDRPHVRDQIVMLGTSRSNPSSYPLRLIEV